MTMITHPDWMTLPVDQVAYAAEQGNTDALQALKARGEAGDADAENTYRYITEGED